MRFLRRSLRSNGASLSKKISRLWIRIAFYWPVVRRSFWLGRGRSSEDRFDQEGLPQKLFVAFRIILHQSCSKWLDLPQSDIPHISMMFWSPAIIILQYNDGRQLLFIELVVSLLRLNLQPLSLICKCLFILLCKEKERHCTQQRWWWRSTSMIIVVFASEQKKQPRPRWRWSAKDLYCQY